MPIPDFQSIMLPLLVWTADNNEHSLREAYEHLAQHFNLTPGKDRSGYHRVHRPLLITESVGPKCIC